MRGWSDGRLACAISLGLVAVVVAVYGRTLGFDFVGFDDGLYVADNAQVAAGLTRESIAWSFTNDLDANWFPLTWLSWMLDVELFGRGPGGHHGVNVFFHVLNTLLVFQLMRRMTGTLWSAAFVAAVFGLHPLHVESVAWVSERKDVLCAFFGLISLLAYTSFAQRGGAARYAAAFAAMALGLLAKPMLVTLPFVFLLLDYWPLGRLERARPRRCIVEKLPFFALSLASSAITLSVQGSHSAMADADRLPFAARFANALVSYAAYLRKSFVPTDLTFHYPHPLAPAMGGEGIPGYAIALSALALLAISAAALRPGGSKPVAVGWLWFVGMLLPVIGLVQVGRQGMADRYTYLPLIGASLAFVWCLRGLDAWLRARTASASNALRAGVVAWLAVLSWLCFVQVGLWRDSFTLFEHGLRITPRNTSVLYNLANEHLTRGAFDDAIGYYRIALSVHPEYYEAWNNLGNALRGAKRIEAAQLAYREALALNPDSKPSHLGMAYVLRTRGDAVGAIRHYERAVEIDPFDASAHNNLANMLLGTGRPVEAIVHYERAIALRPGYSMAIANLEKAREVVVEGRHRQ